MTSQGDAVRDGASAGSDAPGLQDSISTTITAPFTPAVPFSRTFPVKSWDRYESIEFLGAGGMGKVFKARDPRLGRLVALKLIRGDDPKQIARLFREARAQARIDHKHICKVYEVGEVEGLPYIAMQYIEGQSLRSAKREMTLEQKVRVVKEVAEALHEAHKLGVIHRDIKPGNILVERRDDGEWLPYIMDFGLAREVEASTETMTAQVEGTPAYMAPEQVMSDLHHLDRRTDIYSLGATLYDLLAGRPPFIGKNSMDILVSIVHGDARPPREIEPAIPTDLDTIVMKCLEREVSRRYESAKALAEDLERYLEGDPIGARRATLLYLAVKRAKKHKLIVAISSAALVAVLVLGVISVRAKLAASEQAALAQELGKDVKEMELFLKYAYGLPLHDTGREKAVIRARIERLERRLGQMGSLGAGPGRYAIGCGYLALHEEEKAREHLLQAWESGYRAPELDTMLGQALGNLYTKGMNEAQRVPDKPSREVLRRELAAKYLTPALDHLRRSRAEITDSAVYIDALIAFYEGRFEDSLSLASQAFKEAPWHYDAKKLEGDIHYFGGCAKREQGKPDEASSDLRKALSAYRTASAMGRSDAAIYEAEAGGWVELMAIEWNRGVSPEVELHLALTACDNALLASPESAGAYAKKSSAYLYWGNYLLSRGEDPVAALQASIAMGEGAIRWGPRDATALRIIGGSYLEIGNYEAEQGRDPRPSLDRAVASCESAVNENPNHARAWMTMAVALSARAQYEARRGENPAPWFDRSIEAAKRAHSLEPGNGVVLSNECFTHGVKAAHELSRGVDPALSTESAVETCEAAIKLNPSFFHIYNNLAIAHLIRARYALAMGSDPGPSLDQAELQAANAIRLNSGHSEAYQHAAAAHALRAQRMLEQRVDPSAALEQGRAMVKKMVEINATSFQSHLSEAKIELLAARAAAQRGKPPAQALIAAEAALQKALQANSREAEIQETFAELYRWAAELRKASRKERDDDITRGLSMAAEALTIDPWSSEAIALQGALYVLQARAEPAAARRSQPALLARGALEKALKANPLLSLRYGALLVEAKRLSDDAPGDTSSTSGVASERPASSTSSPP